MKPRIKMMRSEYSGKTYWICIGTGTLRYFDGTGLTPKDAYDCWLMQIPF